MKKFCLVVSIVLLFANCASLAPKRELIGDTFSSEAPPFTVKFKNKIEEFEFRDNLHIFQFLDGPPVIIRFGRNSTPDTNIDYWDALHTIGSHPGFHYMGKIHFNNHEWARFVYINEDDVLLTGYLTRKDHQFIYIFIPYQLDKKEVESVGRYRKTQEMTQEDLDFLEKQFAILDFTVDILR